MAGNAKACRQITALLGYDTGRYGATASYDILYGNAGAANGLTSSHFDRRVIASAYAMLDQLKIGGGVIDRTIRAATGPSTRSCCVGAAYPLAPRWCSTASSPAWPDSANDHPGHRAPDVSPVEAHGHLRRHRPHGQRWRGRRGAGRGRHGGRGTHAEWGDGGMRHFF
jgi:hypothetical protein